MVKSLHPIEQISARISPANARRVRLERESGGAARGDELTDIDAAVVQALAEPLEFPPLSAATVPGDRIAIALDDAVPCAARVLRGAIEAFRRAGVDPRDISIVTTDAETSRACHSEWGESGGDVPQFVVHDPDDHANLCLLGTTKRREPLLVNRTIFDADVVLPIGVARLGGCGVYDSLFPRFSNVETLQRYRMPTNITSGKCASEQAHETQEAGWLIGAPMVLQVVAGHDESVAHVVAGEPQAVARRGEALCRAHWSLHSPQRASLVIATVTGGAATQSWQNVGRALATAEQLVTDGGAVALCTNLDEPPGESLGRLIGSDDLAKTERKIFHDHGEDSWPAWQLARALQRGPVYFLSQLEEETVEDMGLAPVVDLAEIARLAGRHDSFILVEDSQHAVVTVNDEENE